LALIQRDLALLPAKNGTFIVLGEVGNLLFAEVALLFDLKSYPRTLQPVGLGFGTQGGNRKFAAGARKIQLARKSGRSMGHGSMKKFLISEPINTTGIFNWGRSR
jgi:hypothetical protein